MSVEYFIKRQRWLNAFLFAAMPLIWWSDLPDPGWAPRLFATALFLIVVSWSAINYLSNDMTRSRAAFCWIAFLLWSAVMSMAARSSGDALLETLRRCTGFVLAVCFGGMLRQLPERSYHLSRWAAFASVFLAVLFFADALPAWFGKRAVCVFPVVDYSFGATLGNKNFLAEAVMLLLFFLPAGFRDTSAIWRRTIRAVAVLSVGWLVLLESAAVLIGLLAGLVYYLPARFSFSRWVRIGFPICLLLGLFLSTHLQERIFRSYGLLTSPIELESHNTADDGSSFERVLMLKNSWQLFREHPVIGIGVTDWRIDQARFGLGGNDFLNTGLERFEHPHNEFVLTTVETGLIGLLLLLLAIGFLFRPSSTALGAIDLPASRAALIAGLTTACFAYPFSGDVPWYLFMLHAGVLLAAVTVPVAPRKGNRLTWSSLLLALMLSATVYGSFQRLRAEFHHGQGIAAQLKNDHRQSVYEYWQAENHFYTTDRTGTPIDWYLGNELFRDGDTVAALEVLERAATSNPYHARVLNDLASIYEKCGRYPEAIACYREALESVPGMAATRLNLAAAYYNSGTTEKAFEAVKSIRHAERLKGRDQKNYRQFSLVIGRQLALEHTASTMEGLQRSTYVERAWSDEFVYSCLGKTNDAKGFLQCMRGQ